MANAKYTAKQFEADIDAFILKCESEGIEPDDYNLVKHLKVSATTLERYRAGDNENSKAKEHEQQIYKGFGNALKKLEQYREHYCLEQVKDNPKLVGHVALKLKQQRWGGWTDKQEVNQDMKISLQINGKDAGLLG